MANATSSSTAIVLTENDIRGAALERCKPAKHRRRSLSSLDLVVWAPLWIRCIACVSASRTTVQSFRSINQVLQEIFVVLWYIHILSSSMTSQLTELAYSFFANNSENIGPIWKTDFASVVSLILYIPKSTNPKFSYWHFNLEKKSLLQFAKVISTRGSWVSFRDSMVFFLR